MNTIFWNVDTQYDFMRNDGSFKGALPVPGAREIEGNLETLTKLAEATNTRVVNTADWHTPESEEFSDKPDYRTTFPPHCLQNTKGAQYVPATAPEEAYAIDWQKESYNQQELELSRNIILYKDAFDVFAGNKHTEEVLKTINPVRAIVYGVATNVCVDFAVKGLLERDIEIYVVKDAIKELPGVNLEEQYQAWKDAGAKIIETNQVEEYLR